MGMLTAVYRAGSTVEFALVFRSPEVWEEAILELLTTQRPPPRWGIPIEVQTAGRLREYVIGAPLRWHGFERTVEEALRRAAAPEAVIREVRRAGVGHRSGALAPLPPVPTPCGGPVGRPTFRARWTAPLSTLRSTPSSSRSALGGASCRLTC
jgi:hypothetical protein